MLALFEGLWYSLLIIFKVCWLPVLVILVVYLIARLAGAAKRAKKK